MQTPKKQVPPQALYPRLKALMWPAGRLDLKTRTVIAFSLLIVAKVIGVRVPFFYKAAVDQLSNPKIALLIIPMMLVLAYAVARVLSQIFSELRDVVFVHVAQHAIRSTSRATFEHLHSLSLKFHLERKTGSVARTIEKGAEGIEYLLYFMLFNIIPTLFEIALVCVILLRKYELSFALVTLVTIVLYVIFTLLVSEQRNDHRRKANEADIDAAAKAVDSLLNFETVKYFSNEDLEIRRFDISLERYQKASILSQNSLAFLNIGQGSIIAAGLFGVMGLAARGVYLGHMTVGDFVLVNAFLVQLYMPLNFLGFVYRQIKQSLIDMENMSKLLEVEPDVQDEAEAPVISVPKGEIEFRNVSFRYDERVPVLKNVSFQVPAGRTVAIVGASGAGKSTISRLLFRFYDVTDGEILIDGQNISKVVQSSVRQCIGIVPQDTVLFNDSIGYNIQYGRFDATKEEVIEAARLAQIHRFIEGLPDGYDTMVGERGLKLSGGEKQRIAIARMILKNPPILVFDEATSALDTHTEKEIQSALKRVSQNKTTVVIAHRLSTIVDADQILVLSDGQVAEQGTHQELLAKAGLYFALWQRQEKSSEHHI